MKSSESTVAEAVTGAPESALFCSAAVFGDSIAGEVSGASSDAPQISVFDGDVPIGSASCRSVPDSDGSVRWRYELPLPADLFDGEVHALRVDCNGVPAAVLNFAGDPRIRMPKNARALTENKGGAKRDGVGDASRTEPSPDLLVPQSLMAVMNGLIANSQALQALVTQQLSTRMLPAAAAPVEFFEFVDRYGPIVSEAALARPGGLDFVWLGVIDWAFRIQRPQHLALNLANLGHRVVYVSVHAESADEKGRFRILCSPHPGVFEVKLRVRGQVPDIYRGFDDKQLAEIQAALDEMVKVLHLRAPVAVVEYPSWHLAAASIPGATVVHDCLDLVEGFSNVSREIVALEKELIQSADLVVVSSLPLVEHVEKQRPCVLVRNGAEVKFFAEGAEDAAVHMGEPRPVIGYIGAISEWYDVDWVAACAAARPDWDFRLIGAADCDVSALQDIDNVQMLGELPYSALPAQLAQFDVAVIPFKLTPLIICTNPVKLYEYMAAGKPVVASPMPEVVAAAPGLVYIAKTAQQFEAQIERALAEDSPALRETRKAWARQHDWLERAQSFLDAVKTTSPTVSVVILAYNNWFFTRNCINSVLLLSDYPDLEVIVVDNASTDETREALTGYAARDPRVRLLLQDENLGFAAGNNAGIREASGDYIVLLNNDTYVTRGWIRDLIRPLQLDPGLGLVGPVTNNIGNEQKLAIHYSNMVEMAARSRAFVTRHLRRRWPTDNLAFFCVATRRDVIEKVGLLDEAYGLGFFEDDDYCKRVLEAGYTIAIADDVFVHHHLSASFDELGSETKRELMEQNKALFSQRWGTWKPHSYRAAPGFGQ